EIAIPIWEDIGGWDLWHCS
ncbi:calcium/calmodulin-dependent protein kinase, partial [Histoplasma capsulatum]